MSWFILLNASRVDSHLLIRKRPLGTWFLLINASRVDSYLLIRKRPLGTLDTSINVFRVVFTLVDKITASWDLVTINQCI